MRPKTQNLRYVARHLRYWQIALPPEYRVVLRSLGSVSADIIQAIAPHLPGVRLEPYDDTRLIEYQLAQYGFWDATFRAYGDISWSAELTGLPLLASLGYFETGELADGWQDLLGDNQLIYRELRREIDRGELFLRVFVVADADPIRHLQSPAWMLPRWRISRRIEGLVPRRLRWSRSRWSLPRRYFPQPCTITDATITNIRSCWLCRHPYG